jgi:putative sterol carrier protein
MLATSGSSVVRTEANGGWSVNDGTYKMGRGKIDNPNVTFAASDEDWVSMSNKTLKVPWAYLTGRLKIQGAIVW